jgi:hypothetical protein
MKFLSDVDRELPVGPKMKHSTNSATAMFELTQQFSSKIQ